MSVNERNKALDTKSSYESLADRALSPKENEKGGKEEEQKAAKAGVENKKAEVRNTMSSERADIALEVSTENTNNSDNSKAAPPAVVTTKTSGEEDASLRSQSNPKSEITGIGDKIKGFFSNLFSKFKGLFEGIKSKFSGIFGEKDAEKASGAAAAAGAVAANADQSEKTQPASHSVSSAGESSNESQNFSPSENNPEANEVSSELPGELINDLKEVAKKNGAKLTLAPKMVYMANSNLDYKSAMKEKRIRCLARSNEFNAKDYYKLHKNTQQTARLMSEVILRYLRAGKIPFLYAVQVNINGVNMRMPTTWHKHPNTQAHKNELASKGFSPGAIQALVKKHPGVEVWPQKSAPSGTLA